MHTHGARARVRTHRGPPPHPTTHTLSPPLLLWRWLAPPGDGSRGWGIAAVKDVEAVAAPLRRPRPAAQRRPRRGGEQPLDVPQRGVVREMPAGRPGGGGWPLATHTSHLTPDQWLHLSCFGNECNHQAHHLCPNLKLIKYVFRKQFRSPKERLDRKEKQRIGPGRHVPPSGHQAGLGSPAPAAGPGPAYAGGGVGRPAGAAGRPRRG